MKSRLSTQTWSDSSVRARKRGSHWFVARCTCASGFNANGRKEKLRVMKNNTGSDPSNNPNHAKWDSFATKVGVVTGASRGIGLALAKSLIANGYRVVANSRNIGSAMTLQNTPDLKLVDGDIALQETAKQVVAIAVQNFGRIDLLVNNAGVFIPKSFTEYTVEEFRVVRASAV